MSTNLLRVLPQYLVPQHAISRLAGIFTNCKTPWFKNWLIKQFIKYYKVDMSTAIEPDPTLYVSFNGFFTRKLRPEVRPIVNAAKAIACPVDGTISQLGVITQGRIIQAKRFHYDVQQLLGGDTEHAAPFIGGSFITLYLAPRDYHRVHLPLDATLCEMIYIPGKLFSVNQLTTETIPNLFANNERIAMLFDTAAGPMAVVMVGAMIAASMHITWAGMISPPPGTAVKKWHYQDQNKQFSKGDEIGYFQLGSTVIVLFGAGAVKWSAQLQPNQAVQFGQLLGLQPAVPAAQTEAIF